MNILVTLRRFFDIKISRGKIFLIFSYCPLQKTHPEEIIPETDEYARSFDHNTLQIDDKFKSINAEIISIRRWNINSLEKINIEIKELMTKIEIEISRNKNEY